MCGGLGPALELRVRVSLNGLEVKLVFSGRSRVTLKAHLCGHASVLLMKCGTFK